MNQPEMSVGLPEMGVRVSRSVVAVIDTLTQRGAFRGEELTTVGQLRDQAIQLRALSEAAESQNESGEPTEALSVTEED